MVKPHHYLSLIVEVILVHTSLLHGFNSHIVIPPLPLEDHTKLAVAYLITEVNLGRGKVCGVKLLWNILLNFE